MKPTTERAEQKDDAGDMREQAQFVRQRQDDSLPAAQVLTEQKQGNQAEGPTLLFVP